MTTHDDPHPGAERPLLAGIRILDFGRYVAGPYCATLLGYLGAEVIRIERRGGGEDRFIAPIASGGEGAVFFQTSCNKKSMTLDPAKAGARGLIERRSRPPTWWSRICRRSNFELSASITPR